MSAVMQLAAPERAELYRHEETITRARNAFVAAGEALAAIRDRKLYRETHSTFEDYCQERWQFTRAHAYQLIAASGVVGNLSTTVDILPATESQARPLAKLDPQEQREAWAEVVETAPKNDSGEPVITARQVEAVIEKRANVHFSSETGEHYTPTKILEPIVAFMGAIDLDPCANPGKTVPATTHYTKEDDGLSQEWHGKVFVNPPYGDAISAWIDKAIEEFMDGRAEEIVLLLPARTDTQWFAKLRDCPICFVRGRITFVGNDSPAPFPSCLVLMTEEASRESIFAATMESLGDTWQRM